MLGVPCLGDKLDMHTCLALIAYRYGTCDFQAQPVPVFLTTLVSAIAAHTICGAHITGAAPVHPLPIPV